MGPGARASTTRIRRRLSSRVRPRSVAHAAARAAAPAVEATRRQARYSAAAKDAASALPVTPLSRCAIRIHGPTRRLHSQRVRRRSDRRRAVGGRGRGRGRGRAEEPLDRAAGVTRTKPAGAAGADPRRDDHDHRDRAGPWQAGNRCDCLESLPALWPCLVRVRPGRPAAHPAAVGWGEELRARTAGVRLPRPGPSESSFRTDPSVCPVMLRRRF